MIKKLLALLAAGALLFALGCDVEYVDDNGEPPDPVLGIERSIDMGAE